jgi:hypothetical protein
LLEAKEQVVSRFKRFVMENNDPHSAKFRGNIYEHLIQRHFMHASLPSILQGKCLDTGIGFELTAPSNIHVKGAYCSLEDIVLAYGQPLYAFPASKTDGANDSFLWSGIDTCYIFQSTLAAKHEILNPAVKQFLNSIKKINVSNLDFKFVFLTSGLNLKCLSVTKARNP